MLHYQLLQLPMLSDLDSCLNFQIYLYFSGGKDSCFNLLKCIAENHEVVALAHLSPQAKGFLIPISESMTNLYTLFTSFYYHFLYIGETDSFMYQSVGSEIIDAVAQALDLPLYKRTICGESINTGKYYMPQAGDEVEDLFELIKEVKVQYETSYFVCLPVSPLYCLVILGHSQQLICIMMHSSIN